MDNKKEEDNNNFLASETTDRSDFAISYSTRPAPCLRAHDFYHPQQRRRP